ncbi:MAG: hypothetical protein NUW37_19020 [Planctomycetes bacterium]|nr:hypothetical protein [Planctomycetota bacterium]
MAALIKFNSQSGAIICDEEYLHAGKRRVPYGDYLESLLDEKQADELDAELIYAMVGTPSLSGEVQREIRKALGKKHKRSVNDEPEVVPFDDLARICTDTARTLVKKWQDRRLDALYGFNSDDFNRGTFSEDGKNIEISQEAVKKRASEMTSRPEKSIALIEHSAIVFGWDRKNGIAGVTFDSATGSSSYISGAFEVIGRGSTAVKMTLQEFVGRQDVSSRRIGRDPIESCTALLCAYAKCEEQFHEVGGYPRIIILDGSKLKHSERVKEIANAPAKLAKEIVNAYRWEFIDRKTAHSLIEGVVFANLGFDEAEEKLFASCREPSKLELCLRGYKPGSLPTKAASFSAHGKPKKK